MKSGDPKKVAVLSVVALVVIGMAVFRLVPQGANRPSSGTKPAPRPDTLKSAISTLQNPPKNLTNDPFIHPSLRVDKRETTPQQASSKDKSAPAGSGIPGIEFGSGMGDSGPGGSTAPLTPDPSGFTRSGQQSKEGEKPLVQRTIMVDAIITVGEPRAFIQLDGRDATAYSQGDVVVGAGKILSIGESSVTLQTAKARKQLVLGKEAKL